MKNYWQIFYFCLQNQTQTFFLYKRIFFFFSCLILITSFWFSLSSILFAAIAQSFKHERVKYIRPSKKKNLCCQTEISLYIFFFLDSIALINPMIQINMLSNTKNKTHRNSVYLANSILFFFGFLVVNAYGL